MTSKAQRIVFFGTADFAVPLLFALIDAGHEILAVVTQPDRAQGRGLQLAQSPVKKAALRAGLPILQPRRVRSDRFLEKMNALAPDLLALAAFGQIVPQALLDLPPLGPINVHGSVLPAYRGAAPIQRALMAGETETGVTTMWMDATLDTGDILLIRRVPIDPDDDAGSLFPKLAEEGAALLVETVAGLASGGIIRQPQAHEFATLAPAISPEECAVVWANSASQIRNQLRGLSPRPGLHSFFKGRRIKLLSLCECPGTDGDAGEVLAIGRESMDVAAGQGTVVRLLEVQPESGKRMSAGDWARGARVTPGDAFSARP